MLIKWPWLVGDWWSGIRKGKEIQPATSHLRYFCYLLHDLLSIWLPDKKRPQCMLCWGQLSSISIVRIISSLGSRHHSQQDQMHKKLDSCYYIIFHSVPVAPSANDGKAKWNSYIKFTTLPWKWAKGDLHIFHKNIERSSLFWNIIFPFSYVAPFGTTTRHMRASIHFLAKFGTISPSPWK